jgi:hypothetical protein
MVILCLVYKHKLCNNSCRFSLLPCLDFRIVRKQGGVLAVDVGDVSRDSTALGQHVVTVHQRGHGMLRVDLKTTKKLFRENTILWASADFFLGRAKFSRRRKKYTISALKQLKDTFQKLCFSRQRGSSIPGLLPFPPHLHYLMKLKE